VAYFSEIAWYSQSKYPQARNEDATASGSTCLVVADGATSKGNTAIHSYKSGGEIISRLITEFVLLSDACGIELIPECRWWWRHKRSIATIPSIHSALVSSTAFLRTTGLSRLMEW